MHWKDAPASRLICYCKSVTKDNIIRAITNGARTLDDVKRTTLACTGTKCALENPSGACCKEEVLEMIAYYAPLADALRGETKPSAADKLEKSPE